MCHHKTHKSQISVTGSSNPGHAVCCKPDFVGKNCETIDDTVCSQPAYKDNTADKYKNILSGDNNQQLFAFCPKTTAALCGVGSSTVEDDPNSLILVAGDKAKTITLDQLNKKALQYKDGGSVTGRFHSCFYEIRVGKSQKDKVRHSIQLKVTKASEMNVYAYVGLTRETATISVTDNNNPLTVDKTYIVEGSKGIFLIAYPNKDKATDFAFEYKLGVYKESSNVGAGLVVAIVLFIVAICLMLLTIRCRMRKVHGAPS